MTILSTDLQYWLQKYKMGKKIVSSIIDADKTDVHMQKKKKMELVPYITLHKIQVKMDKRQTQDLKL